MSTYPQTTNPCKDIYIDVSPGMNYYFYMQKDGSKKQFASFSSLMEYTINQPPHDPKCECGTKSVMGQHHSNWCPMFERRF